MLDCIIIGSGVAAISAALTLKANGKDFVILGSRELSTKISKAERISNYPGLISVTGEQFAAVLKEQIDAEELPFKEERVTGVYAMGTSFTCLCESGAAYEGKTAILAVGVESAGKIDGEVEYTGRGVSYCATCDGALYKGKTIAVVCTSKRFEGEVEYLAKIAQKTYFIPLYKGPEVQTEGLETRVKAPVKVEGGLKVQRLVFKDETLDVDGVFMLKESVPPSSLVGGLETKDGHVTVDRHARTNLAGLFAAGDCTGRPYQYAKAVGEGNVAAHSVVEFLREKKA